LSRGLVGDLQGQKVVASPIYKHHYNLQTGECLEDSSVKVPAYNVVVQDDVLYISA
jgi:nitrite reductase (NADH) small subunit